MTARSRFHRQVRSAPIRLALVSTVLAVLLIVAGSARADQLFNESFTGPTVSSALTVGASGGGNPFRQVCLTAGTNTTQTPIPGCTAGQVSIPSGGDPAGQGTLRLTDNENNVAGFLLSNGALPLTAGLDISFDYYAYRGSGADGLSFFLVNGATTLTAPGANGGSLGYAQRNSTPGVANGFLGVGLDEFGNYTNDTENRGNGCATHPPAVQHPNFVGLRGPGNGTTGYCLLASGPAPGPLAVPAATSRNAAGVQQAIEIRVDPPANANPMVTVFVNGTQVLQAAEPANPPATFKFGFAASTGGATDIHEIRNVLINTLQTLPKLTLTNTADGPAVAGGNVNYTLQGTVAPTAGPESQPITITDTLPAGETVSALPSGPGWNCSATQVGSQTVSCTFTPSAALAPGAALPPLTVPTKIDPSARGPLTATAVIGSTDNGNTPAQSTASATVTPMAVVDTSVTVTPPAGAELGKPATFNVAVANAGPSTATATTVKIPVPPGTSFTSGPSGCTLSADVVTCAVGTVAPGQTTTLPLVFTPSVSGAIEVAATVSQTEPDSKPANNTASGTAKVPAPPPPPLPPAPPPTPTPKAADLGVTIDGPSSAPAIGQPAGFTITATNHGPDPDTGVVVSMPVPSGAKVVSLSPDCQVVSNTIVCIAGALGSGDKQSFDVVVTAAAAGPLSLTATTTGDLPDLDPSDNAATAQTDVPGPKPTSAANLAVTLTAAPSVQQAGTTTLTATVANLGPTAATDVTVVVPVPPGFALVATPPGCAAHGAIVICTPGTLKAHHKASFAIKVRPRGAHGRQGTTATARAHQPDPKPANNHARARFTVTPRPVLSLRDHFHQRSVIGGRQGSLTLTVSTANHTTAHHVTVCDTLPPGTSVVSAPGATVHGRRVCFTVSKVTGTPHQLKVVITTSPVTRSTVIRDHATATAPSVRTVRRSAKLVLVPAPLPSFTG